MSRSIHATHARIHRERRFEYASEEARRGRIAPMERQLNQKRYIKAISRRSSGNDSIHDLPAVDLDTFRVEIVDRGGQIHYPASPADVRAVMRRLPCGALAGLSGIRLCLGSEPQEDFLSPEERASAIRDPWTGRIGREYLPGVYGASTRGIYHVESARIDLHAYVHDEPLSAANELYLRLRMLSTLVHELAHHEDFVLRGARSRGRAKHELYATMIQARWVRDCVVPYLQEAYPDAVRRLNEWLAEKGGTSVPLALLGGRWHLDGRGKPVKNCFASACDAYEALVRNVREAGDPTTIRLDFAQDLLFADAYTEALAVIDLVLRSDPQNPEALTLQAEVYWTRQQFDMAESAAERVLARYPTNLRAWRVRVEVWLARGDWGQVLGATDAAIDACRTEDIEGYHLKIFELLRGRAYAEMGNIAAAQATIDRPWPEFLQHRVHAIVAVLIRKAVMARQAL